MNMGSTLGLDSEVAGFVQSLLFFGVKWMEKAATGDPGGVDEYGVNLRPR